MHLNNNIKKESQILKDLKAEVIDNYLIITTTD